MANVPALAGWLNAETMETYGLKVTKPLIAAAMDIYFGLEQDPKFAGQKMSTYMDKSNLNHADRYDDVPLMTIANSEYKTNVLLAMRKHIISQKWVFSNSAERAIPGGARSMSTGYLRDAYDGHHVIGMDATAVSMGRTTFGPVKTFGLRYAGKGDKKVVYFKGAGETVIWDVAMVLYLYGSDIERIIIESTPKPTGVTPTSETVAAKFKDCGIPIEGVTNDDLLPLADMPVTATDAYKVTIDTKKLKANATTVATSAYEFPQSYIQEVRDAGGYLVFENIEKCIHRDAQALSEYFLNQAGGDEKKAVELARAAGVMNLAEVRSEALDPAKPMHVSVVGDGRQDFVVMVLLAAAYAKKIGSEEQVRLLLDCLDLPADYDVLALMNE